MKLARSLQMSLLSLFAVGVLSGCGGDDKGTAPEIEIVIYKPQTSIENVIDNLGEAYRRRDADAYEKLFDDFFYFVFSVQDISENPDLPAEWHLADELASASNMFEDALVESVELDFVAGAPSPATEADIQSHDFPTGTMKVTLSEVELAVEVKDESGGESIIFQMAGDQAIFFLYPHPTAKINGLPVWYIIEWRDITIGGLALAESSIASRATIESSWGVIKYNFR